MPLRNKEFSRFQTSKKIKAKAMGGFLESHTLYLSTKSNT
jgi:hypothetical protein